MTPSQAESHQGPAPVSRAFWCTTTSDVLAGTTSVALHSVALHPVHWQHINILLECILVELILMPSVTGILVQFTLCIILAQYTLCALGTVQHWHSGTQRHTSRAHSVARSFYALNN